MIFKLTLGDWECNGYYANKDYFFESNYSAERITEAYKASCRKYGVQFNSAKHDYTGLGRENLDRRSLVWASFDILPRMNAGDSRISRFGFLFATTKQERRGR